MVTTPTTQPDNGGGGGGLSSQSKSIIGGVVGGVGGAILLGAVAILFWRRHKKQQRMSGQYDDVHSGDTAVAENKTIGGSSSAGTGLADDSSHMDRYTSPQGRQNAATNF